MLDFKIRKLGAKNSFPTIVAFGPNASRPHHQPSRKKLKQKDTVLIDFGAKYKGYCSDITRCFAVGGPTTFYKKVYEVVEQAQAAAILGLEIHESPFLKLKSKGTLKAGQVITIEPGIYIRRQLGVRIEDDVLVTETGSRILTRRCPHSPLLLSRKG